MSSHLAWKTNSALWKRMCLERHEGVEDRKKSLGLVVVVLFEVRRGLKGGAGNCNASVDIE